MPEEQVGFVGQVSDELRFIRGQLERSDGKLENFRDTLRLEMASLKEAFHNLQLQRLHELEKKQVAQEGGMDALREAVNTLRNGQTWLIRAVVGGFIAGAIALVFKFISVP